MSYAYPSTWSFYGSSSDGNQITLIRPGNTVAEPRVCLISRTVPVFNVKSQTWSVPTYRVRVMDGVLDADGNPDPTRTLADVTFRCSVSSNGASRGDEVLADLTTLLNTPGFADAAFKDLVFPVKGS